MRHRAPTPLSRVIGAASPRRGVATGAVVLLGASTGAGLLVLGGTGGGPETGLDAAPATQPHGGTTYPDAATIESIAAQRSNAGTSRGQARTHPSAPVSAAAENTGTPPGQGSTSARASTRPAPSEAGSAPSPGGTSTGAEPSDASSPTTAAPRSTAPPASESPSTASAPTPPPGPETFAVTDVAAAGVWTVVLSSDQVTSFECSLDGAAYAPCGPVATFTGLSPGRHTLAVRAVDASGVADSTPAELSATLSGPGL